MKIFELFDNAAPFNHVESTEDEEIYEFKLGAGYYQVTFYLGQMSFSRSNEESGYPSYDITNTGSASKVFATVINIIKDYIKNNRPETLSMVAEEPSRVKLYNAMSKIISSQMGYSLETTNDGDGMIYNFSER